MTKNKTANLFLLACLVLALAVIFWRAGERLRAARSSDRDFDEGRSPSYREASPSGATDGLPSKSGTRDPREKPRRITTASGLQYEVLVEGTGPRPGPTDKVRVHYHGTTPEGEVFDSSLDRGEPTSFALNQVIKGWTEGLQLMRVGGKFRFTIPPDLAYGERGAGGKIGPNQTLIFEVELLAIE